MSGAIIQRSPLARLALTHPRLCEVTLHAACALANGAASRRELHAMAFPNGVHTDDLVAALTFLFGDGLVTRHGDVLTWHGPRDLADVVDLVHTVAAYELCGVAARGRA